MKVQQVAAQLYTVRDYLKTPTDIAASMKKVREAGYTAVQVSGLGPIHEAELLDILDGEGLVCCSTHESSDTILNEPEKIVERLAKLGCTYTAYPYPSGVDFSSLDAVKELARRLNHAGKVLHDAGRVLTYHNHNIEFCHVGGKAALEVIYDETDPRYVQSEIDTYWVQAGGACPVEWCTRMKGRAPLLHLKDFGVNEKNQGVMSEIGRGNINWKKVIAAAEEGGCEWFIVEQDRDWINNDPFESLKVSLEYIQNRLCERRDASRFTESAPPSGAHPKDTRP